MSVEHTKAAVTGATGCLGRPLVEELAKMGADIKALGFRIDPRIGKFARRVDVVKGGLDSGNALRALTEDCDIVFHLAGKVHSLSTKRENEEEFFDVNVKGTKLLLDAAAVNKVKRVVFYSTVGVYGKDADFHGDELSPCMPKSVYAKSKYEAERRILDSEKNGGPEGVVLRFPIAYGPLDRGNVAALIRAVNSRRFFYLGNGKIQRSMICSTNAAEAALKAAFEPDAANQVFCVTDGTDCSIRDLVETICLALDTKWRPRQVPISVAKWMGRLGSLIEGCLKIQLPINSSTVRKLGRPLTFSCEKARRVLRYKPRESLAEGIEREVEWLKAVHGWK